MRPLTEEERRIINELPLDETAWLSEIGVKAWGDRATLVERIGARPTLDVNSIVGGYTGPGGKTVPAHAHAKISMRLVPDGSRGDRAFALRNAPPEVRVELPTPAAARLQRLDYTHGRDARLMNLRQIYASRYSYASARSVVNDFKRQLGLRRCSWAQRPTSRSTPNGASTWLTTAVASKRDPFPARVRGAGFLNSDLNDWDDCL